MARPKKGVVPQHLRKFLKKKKAGSKKKKAMPAFLRRKLGRKKRR